MATPDKRIIRTFGVIDRAPLQVGTSAVLCMAEQFGAFDKDNLIVPIWMIQNVLLEFLKENYNIAELIKIMKAEIEELKKTTLKG